VIQRDGPRFLKPATGLWPLSFVRIDPFLYSLHRDVESRQAVDRSMCRVIDAVPGELLIIRLCGLRKHPAIPIGGESRLEQSLLAPPQETAAAGGVPLHLGPTVGDERLLALRVR
jgi:hypothetical protein